jgi:predicted nucleic acid-binding protein
MADHAWTTILEIAAAHELTVYDAAYLELSLRAALPLATLDDALQRAAGTIGVVLLGHR